MRAMRAVRRYAKWRKRNKESARIHKDQWQEFFARLSPDELYFLSGFVTGNPIRACPSLESMTFGGVPARELKFYSDGVACRLFEHEYETKNHIAGWHIHYALFRDFAREFDLFSERHFGGGRQEGGENG